MLNKDGLFALATSDHMLSRDSLAGIALYPSTSPDQTKLAYYQFSSTTQGDGALAVVSLVAQGSSNLIPWQPNWISILGWLTDDQLVIALDNPSGGSVLVLNPYTGQAQEVSPSLPNVFVPTQARPAY